MSEMPALKKEDLVVLRYQEYGFPEEIRIGRVIEALPKFLRVTYFDDNGSVEARGYRDISRIWRDGEKIWQRYKA